MHSKKALGDFEAIKNIWNVDEVGNTSTTIQKQNRANATNGYCCKTCFFFLLLQIISSFILN